MNLYLRLFLLLLKLIGLPRRGVFEESRVTFRVLPTDCDINLHMNNGRYLSFMDLGRLHLVAQMGLLRIIVRKRWRAALGAAEINFIRAIRPFQQFDLITRLVTWDDKWAYMEQRFEVGDVLCAHSFVKGLFLDGRGRVESSTVVAELGLTGAPPPMPRELEIWAELGSVKKQNA
ncbi:MAG TPA: thioesterase family protein [Burkholderiales bacterium]|nr:thioesterase family protein [Burkholderiales bacterium]